MRREQGLRLQVEPRVDWFAILVGLQRCGLSAAAVAIQTTIPRTTILGYKQGAEPKHADGERLIALWAGITGNDRKRVPMTSCPEWLER